MGGRSSSSGLQSRRNSFVAEELRSVETQNWNRRTEQVVTMTQDGQIVAVLDGTRHEVRIPQEDAVRMRDGILTHNHPDHGGTFSIEDVRALENVGLYEIRATSAQENRIYSLVRINTAVPTGSTRDNAFSKAYESAILDFKTRVANVEWNSSAQTQEDADRCNKMVRDFMSDWLKSHAKDYGYKYTIYNRNYGSRERSRQ